MQIFQDEIFRTKQRLSEVNAQLNKRIDELEKRIQHLEQLVVNCNDMVESENKATKK
jgi:hypothetical protein